VSSRLFGMVLITQAFVEGWFGARDRGVVAGCTPRPWRFQEVSAQIVNSRGTRVHYSFAFVPVDGHATPACVHVIIRRAEVFASVNTCYGSANTIEPYQCILKRLILIICSSGFRAYVGVLSWLLYSIKEPYVIAPSLSTCGDFRFTSVFFFFCLYWSS
jgi:hypothetical protein